MIELDVIKLVNNWGQIAEGMEEQAEALVGDTLKNLQQHVETAMRLPKSGKVYGGHVASEPEDAPAVDTGDLINSAKAEHDGMEGTLTYTSDHALHMEYGAPNANVEARPFLAPAVEAERPAFDAAVKGLIKS